jgi:hypothetical protein
MMGHRCSATGTIVKDHEFIQRLNQVEVTFQIFAYLLGNVFVGGDGQVAWKDGVWITKYGKIVVKGYTGLCGRPVGFTKKATGRARKY